jgi:glutamate decarboxylase
MPASADIITVSQPLENLDVKHGLSGSYEDVTVVEKPARNVPWFASLPDRQQHSHFLKEAVDLMLEKAVFQATNRSNRVVEWRAPEELQKLIDLDLSADPANHDKLLQLLKDIIQYSVKTGHPFFINQLFSR